MAKKINENAEAKINAAYAKMIGGGNNKTERKETKKQVKKHK